MDESIEEDRPVEQRSRVFLYFYAVWGALYDSSSTQGCVGPSLGQLPQLSGLASLLNLVKLTNYCLNSIPAVDLNFSDNMPAALTQISASAIKDKPSLNLDLLETFLADCTKPKV